MTHEEFEEFIQDNILTDGTYEDTLLLLALVGVVWVREARKQFPSLSLDDVEAALFVGRPFPCRPKPVGH